jgi:osmotically-inducible protein OsmY
MSHDSDLQMNVLEELKWEPSVIADHVAVTAKEGVVTLSGYVDNFMNRNAAERAARRVQGVKAVVEQLKVKLPPSNGRTDEQIATAVVDRLAWNVSAPKNAIEVKVENGHVTLSGQVQWHFEKEAAELEVQHLYGVTGVTSLIVLKPRPDTAAISENIQSALKRSWYTRPDSISVSAVSGRVKLTGIVHSPHAKAVAGAVAWNSPGATVVQNELTIS